MVNQLQSPASRREGSIPSGRTLDNQGLTGECSQSAAKLARGIAPAGLQGDLPLFDTPWGIQTQLWTDFQEFLAAHPDIWAAFERLAFQLIKRGVKHYSADGILHVIRFEVITSNDGGKPYKINNNFSACFSRYWAMRNPRQSSLFERRRSKADMERGAAACSK